MRKMNIVMMTVAGLLLMAAAVLKTHEVMNVAIPSWDVRAQIYMDDAAKAGEVMPVWKANAFGFFESYEFFLIQIPVEFALGAWMVCGLFRKAAWIAGTLAYFMFIFITLIKALLGFESCGCFGQVHVDPWVTLFVVDIPFFLLLAIFRPKGHKLLPPPWPNVGHAVVCAVPILAVLVLAAPMVVTFRPDFKKPTQQTEVTAENQIKLLKFQQKRQKAEWQKQTDMLNKQIATLQQTIERLNAQMTQVKESAQAEILKSKKLAQGEIDKLKAALDAQRLAEIEAAKAEEAAKEAAKAAAKVEPDKTVEPVQVDPAQRDKTSANPMKPDKSELETPPAEVKKWEWMEFVVEDEVREKISEGLAIVLMYHHDCPTCADVVPAYSKYYKEMAEQGNDAFKIAFLAVPPYAETGPIPEDTTCILGKMTDKEKWEVMSPYVVALLNGELMKTWKQGTAPKPEKILDEVFGQ